MKTKKSNMPAGVPHHDICDTLIVNAIIEGDTDRAIVIYNETYRHEIVEMLRDPNYKPSHMITFQQYVGFAEAKMEGK